MLRFLNANALKVIVFLAVDAKSSAGRALLTEKVTFFPTGKSFTILAIVSISDFSKSESPSKSFRLTILIPLLDAYRINSAFSAFDTFLAAAFDQSLSYFDSAAILSVALRYFSRNSSKSFVLSSPKYAARSFSVSSSSSSNAHFDLVFEVQRQFMTSAALPEGSPGNISPFENFSSSSLISPSTRLCESRVRPSSTASHCLTMSAPLAFAACCASREEVC